jgi:hypothetical protein
MGLQIIFVYGVWPTIVLQKRKGKQAFVLNNITFCKKPGFYN